MNRIDLNVRYALSRGLVVTAVEPRNKQWLDCEPLQNFAEWEQAKHRHGAGINAAIHLNPSNLCVFDFDTPDGFAEFVKHYAIPDTAMVQTRRGRHVFFRRPDDFAVGISGTIELPEVGAVGDYLCGNDIWHYTMLPGSVHPSGYVYSWLRPPHDGIALLPGGITGSILRDAHGMAYWHEELQDE
jgi:hypothetical protein